MNQTQLRNKAHFEALAIAEKNKDKIKVYHSSVNSGIWQAPRPKRLSNGR